MTINTTVENAGPTIAELPENCTERLIDAGQLCYDVSTAGFQERYHRGETSHTIHVWWARRPHSAMRALTFATLTKDTSEEAVATMVKLAADCDDDTLETAREIVREGYEEAPKVLDMFGGGGTIPMEAKTLGADVYTIDSNELSTYIQKCNLQYANQADLDIAQGVIEEAGVNVLMRLRSDTDWLYPLRKNGKTFGYLWTYKAHCPECGHDFYLIRRPLLSTREVRPLAFCLDPNSTEEKIEIKSVSSDYTYPTVWMSKNGHCQCPRCHAVISDINIQDCEEVLLAEVDAETTGKTYRLAEPDAIPSDSEMEQAEAALLRELDVQLPSSELPVWTGIVNPAVYGIKTHADFLNRRQRLFLLYLIKELRTEYSVLCNRYPDMAKFAIGSLSSLIDQVIDWNCRLSTWLPTNEQVGRAFCGPGIAMVFDYAETDMILSGPANLWNKLMRIVRGVSSLKHTDGKIEVECAYAQELPYSDNSMDAIVTDPPYYDNLYYSVLSDFFFAWKRLLLQDIEPELFCVDHTDIHNELVASSRRPGKGATAHESFCIEMQQAFSEAARVLKPDGVMTFTYSHSSVNGWDALVQSLRKAPLLVTSAQPLAIERKARPRAIQSQAVNTCITFVVRKADVEREPISIEEVWNQVYANAQSFGLSLMQDSGWAGADAGMAVFACAVGMLANAECVEGMSDSDALIAISKILKELFPGFKIKTRKPL